MKELILGSLLGDSISLGPHWVYDSAEIARKIADPSEFHDPISEYHPGKRAGDQTHYGDQVVLLLRHLAAEKRFELERWAGAWAAYWRDPATNSYRDGATRDTLANLDAGLPPDRAGSDSQDLAGASRIVPLFLLDWADDEALVSACRSLTAFTHRDAQVVAAAEFFARMLLEISRGDAVEKAMERAGTAVSDLRLAGWLERARESAASGKPDGAVLADHGLSCNVDGGFGGVCHLLLRHPGDPLTALVENAKAGGDNAARGMLLGMAYGACGGLDKLPAQWLDRLRARKEVEESCRALGG